MHYRWLDKSCVEAEIIEPVICLHLFALLEKEGEEISQTAKGYHKNSQPYNQQTNMLYGVMGRRIVCLQCHLNS